MHTRTILVKRWLFAPAVFEAMKVYLYTLFLQGGQFVKYIHHPAIIRGVGYIEGNDM